MRLATLRLWCHWTIEGGWLLIALVVPLAFAPGCIHPFEPAKAAVLRTVVTGMAAAWLMDVVLLVPCPVPHVSRILHRVSCIRHPVPALTLVLALVYATATIGSIAPRISLWGSTQWRQGTYTFLCLLILFVLIARRLRTRRQRDRLIAATLCASALVSGYGLLQIAGLDPIPWERAEGERAFATLGHPNFLGLYVAMTMPLAAARLLTTRGWLGRGLYAGLLLIQAGCLLVTFSRSAWLGMVAAGMGFALLVGIQAQRTRWAMAVLGLTTLILAVGAALAWADPGAWVSGGPLEPVHSFLRGKSATTAIRALEWQATARLVAARPVLGTGPESFELAFQAVYPPALAVYGGIGATGGRAHNEVLEWAVNVGLPGLMAYLVLIAIVCWRGWQAARRSSRDGVLAAGLVAGVAAYLVANQFSPGTIPTLSALWASLGLLAAAGFRDRVGDVHRGDEPKVGTAPLGEASQGGQETVAPWKLVGGGGLTLAVLSLVVVTNLTPLLADGCAHDGMRHLVRGDWSAAIAAYERALVLQPDQDRYQALLASAYLAQGVNGETRSFPAAETALERAIALSPMDEAHWLDLGDVRRYRGEALSDPVHLDRALAAYQEAQRLAPTDPEPLVKIGQVYASLGQATQAMRAYQAALALDPLNASAYTQLALAYEALGRPSDAAEARRQAIRAAVEVDRLVSKR